MMFVKKKLGLNGESSLSKKTEYICALLFSFTDPFIISPIGLLQIPWRLPLSCCRCSTSLCWMLPGK